MAIARVLPLVAVLCVGCAVVPYRPDYGQAWQAGAVAGSSVVKSGEGGRVSFTSQGMRAGELLVTLAREYGVNCYISSELADRPIWGGVSGVPESEAIATIGRSVGGVSLRQGSTWYIGNLNTTDRGTWVCRIMGVPRDDIERAMAGCLSTYGKVTVTGQGVVVVADVGSAITQCQDVAAALSSVGSDSWAVQVWVVGASVTADLRHGADVMPSATWIWALQGGGGEWVGRVAAEAVASLDRRRSAWLAAPSLVAEYGEESVYSAGRRFPVPRYTVSDAGTVSVSGYDWIDTGLRVGVKVAGGRLAVALRMSDDVGMVESAPILDTREWALSCTVQPGRVVKLGEVVAGRRSSSWSWLTFGWGERSDTVEVWALAYPLAIGGGAASESAGVPLGVGGDASGISDDSQIDNSASDTEVPSDTQM